MDLRTCAIILAAGVGARMGGDVTKQKINILGRSVLHYALSAFEACADVDDIVLVVRADELDFARKESEGITKLHAITVGGGCRAESAANGFYAIPSGTAVVAVHDAARALIKPEQISAVIAEAKKTGAASAVSMVTDTIKSVDERGIVVGTVDRRVLRKAQTPQVFSVELYKRALDKVADYALITDDNMMVERIGVKISAVDVGDENIKLTTPSDLKYAEFLLRERGF